MNPVEWQRTFALSRLSSAPVRFGRAVERAGAGKSCEYGGESVIDTCSAVLTAVGTITTALATDAKGAANQACKITTPGGVSAAIFAYKDLSAPVDMSVKQAFSLLIKPTVAIAAGVLQVRVSNTAGLGGTPVTMDIPALAAGKWHRLSLPFTGLATSRNAVLSWGIYAVSDPTACDITVDEAGYGFTAYGIEGFAKDDAVKYDTCPAIVDSYPVNHDFLVLSGLVVATLAPGNTCVSTQRLYPFPGGELVTTEIVDGSRPIFAMEDQATAGGQVAVVV